MSKKSSYENLKKWRQRVKQLCIYTLGGECQICGYHKSKSALELHHVDPTEKEFSISHLTSHGRSWNLIFEELKKCILLCSNCHREIHEDLTTLPDTYKKFDEIEAEAYRFEIGGQNSGNNILSEIDKQNLRIKIKYNINKQKKKRKSQTQIENRKEIMDRRELSIQERKDFILGQTQIDYSKFGWAIQLANELDISSASTVRWLSIYMPEFYETCYKTKAKGIPTGRNLK